MTKREKPARTIRTLTERELATTTGGYEQGGVSAPDDWSQSIIKKIGGSGLVIPGLT